MKDLIKPVIRTEIPETVKKAVCAARAEFGYRQKTIQLASQLQYAESREEVRDIEDKLLRQSASMVFEMAIRENAEKCMSDKELAMYRSML